MSIEACTVPFFLSSLKGQMSVQPSERLQSHHNRGVFLRNLMKFAVDIVLKRTTALGIEGKTNH